MSFWVVGGMLVTTGLSYADQNAKAGEVNATNSVNAQAKNKVRLGQNAETAARNSLSRWVQSVNNNKVLEAGGKALESNLINARRNKDAELTASFSDSIRAAEQMGNQAAQAAAYGVDGNVVDAVNMSTALRESIVRQGVIDAQAQSDFDTASRAGTIMSQMVSGLDGSMIQDSLDYNVDTPAHQEGPNGLMMAAQFALQAGSLASATTTKPPAASTTTGGTGLRTTQPQGIRFGFNYDATPKSMYGLTSR